MRPPMPVVFRALVPPHPPKASRFSGPAGGGVPFFKDPAHTVPTKWSLYRPLLRALAQSQRSVRPTQSTKGRDMDLLRPTITAIARADAAAGAVVAPASRTYSRASDPSGPSKAARAQALAVPESRDEVDAASGLAYPHLLAAVRGRWRRAKGGTSISLTREFLARHEQILDDLGHIHHAFAAHGAAAVRALERLQDAEDAAAEWHIRANKDRLERERKQHNGPRPRLTGGLLRPTQFNGPLPRLSPQPQALSMMIHNRLRTRERRREARIAAVESIKDMEAEAQFWHGLGFPNGLEDEGIGRSVRPPKPKDASVSAEDRATGLGRTSWNDELHLHIRRLDYAFNREAARAAQQYDPAMLARIQAARRRRQDDLTARAAKRRARDAGQEPADGAVKGAREVAGTPATDSTRKTMAAPTDAPGTRE